MINFHMHSIHTPTLTLSSQLPNSFIPLLKSFPRLPDFVEAPKDSF